MHRMYNDTKKDNKKKQSCNKLQMRTYICAHCRWKEATQCMNTGKIILPKINLILCVFFRMHIYRECTHISILDDHCCCRCCQVFFSYFFFAFWASKCLLECMLFRRCFDFFFLLSSKSIWNISYTVFYSCCFISMFKISRIAQFEFFFSSKKCLYFVIIGSFQRLCALKDCVHSLHLF